MYPTVIGLLRLLEYVRHSRLLSYIILLSQTDELFLALVYLQTGARELSESCVSQNSESLETEQPCLLAEGGGSGCHHREIFATYGQIYILSHFLAKTTCKTTCSRENASGQNFLHILTNHNILNRISNVHLIMIVFLKKSTQRVMS